MPLKQNENENSTVGNKFNYDEFPDEQPKEVKKFVRSKAKKPTKANEET